MVLLRNTQLEERFVDVWSVNLVFNEADLRLFSQTLSVQELSKLALFKSQGQANRYLAVRGAVRRILARYLAIKSVDLRFEVNAYGKPYLSNAALFFNISHSNDCLLVAVSDFDQIGVDIERIKTRSNLLGLAKRCFSVDELNFWCDLSVDVQMRVFYQFWVRKEAFVKAVGRGIALGLEQCELQVPDLAKLSKIPDDFGFAEDWKVVGLQVADEFAAALVMPNRCLVLNQYCFEL
jgi:4'-phosphopantetheinyl transferase